MSAYTHVLLAADFAGEVRQVADRALELSRTFNARLSLIHVVEFLHLDLASEMVLPQDLELEEQLVANARAKLTAMAERLGVPETACWVELGVPKYEIVRLAEEQNVDLIVVGSHGRHGIQRLLGSTANAVLHEAVCDVLAVRIEQTGGR